MTPPPDAATQPAPVDDAARDDSVADADLTAADIAWELDDLLDGASTDDLMARAAELADEVAQARGAIADLDTKHAQAYLTVGAVMAFECQDGGPCRHATARSDDDGIAEILPAALARLEPHWIAGQQPAAAFVLIGHAPGKTTVRVRSKDGDVDLRVTVLPATGVAAR